MKHLKFALFFCLILFAVSSCKDKENPEPIEQETHENTAALSKIYVANEHDGTISVIDAATNKVIKTIRINEGELLLMAHNVQAAPDGKTVWVTGVPMDHDSHLVAEELIVIDAAYDTILHRVEIQGDLHMAHVVFDTKGDFAFVTATEAGKVVQVNTKTYQVENTFLLGRIHEPHGMRYANGKLYAANMRSKSIAMIDVASGQFSFIPVNGMAMQTAVTSDSTYVFAALYDTREVVRYNIKTQVLDRIALPPGASGPIQIYPSPDNKKLFVCDQGMMLNQPVSDKVYVIDIAQASVVNTISVGKGPHGVVLSPDGKTAFVSNNAAGSVSVIDVETQAQTAVIKVGNTPNGISFRFAGGSMP